MSIFEQATRQKLRYASSKGLLTTEDLWDLSLIGLDAIAKNLNKQIKDQAEESFIEVKSSANEILELQFEVVKHIIGVKLQEREEMRVSLERRARKSQILDLINQKENEALSQKSLHELRAELEAL